MTLTAAQHRIAAFIDQAVSQYPDTAKGTEALLQDMHDYSDAFKRLMDMSTTPEMRTGWGRDTRTSSAWQNSWNRSPRASQREPSMICSGRSNRHALA